MSIPNKGVVPMYAIAFDLDTASLKESYGSSSFNNAYVEIRNVLLEYGFGHQQGSVYFGDDKVNAVTCATVVMELTQIYDWFAPSVKDIRMLRIEDNNDLFPVINSVLKKYRK